MIDIIYNINIVCSYFVRVPHVSLWHPNTHCKEENSTHDLHIYTQTISRNVRKYEYYRK